MQIAQVLAGYTLGGADLLRRAMGKKKPKEMEKQRGIFTEGAVERGVNRDTATYIFDLMEKFAGYGFNKSHSAAYALVSYQTTWLKAHYPAAFMAAVLSADMDSTEKVVTLIEECREMGLEVQPPDVNSSEFMFAIDGDARVVYGLGAIKGVGQSAIEGIVEARKEAGGFANLFEFCQRIDLRKANRRVLDALIRAGALDELGANRATLMIQLPLALKMAEQHGEMQAAGQNDLFGLEEAVPQTGAGPQMLPDDSEEWEEEQRLQGEKETLGLYLTGHPIERYRQEISCIVTARLADLNLNEPMEQTMGSRRRAGRRVVVAGLVVGVRHNQTQRGRMGSVTLDDRSGRLEVTVFSDLYEQYRDLLVCDKVLVVDGNLSFDEYRGGLNLRAEQIYEFEKAREIYASCLLLRTSQRTVQQTSLTCEAFVSELQRILSAYAGGACPVQLEYRSTEASGVIRLGEKWRVTPGDELMRRLERFLGSGSVQVLYGAHKRRAPGPEIRASATADLSNP
jgi:DNA polymerase-3 subunit alpha